MSGAGVVIVGGGLAGQRCAEALRRRGYAGRILIVSEETDPPYDRPPLSKELLAGRLEEDAVAFRPLAWYEDHGVELRLGAAATALDPAARSVTLADGSRLAYGRLLIATGARAKNLPFLRGFENVHTVRTLADVRRLRPQLRRGSRLAVVGAGFIGQEIAATSRELGLEVTVIEALPAPLAGVLGEGVGAWFAGLHRAQGVRMLLGATLDGARGNGRVEALSLAGGDAVECDTVVVGVGVAAATEWLRGSGLEARDGIPTDPGGRTAVPFVFAAGDAASALDPATGRHARAEHWDSAARQGAAAAASMMGADAPAPALPSFWSDQYGLRIQYVGCAAGADRVLIEGDPATPDFAAVYVRGGHPIGALAVGRPRRLIELRREIELSRQDPERPMEEVAA